MKLTVDSLNAENNREYGQRPIPDQLDVEISEWLRTWRNLDESSRLAVSTEMPDECRFSFLCYSERMASLAVRDGDREHIILGLIALGLDGWVIGDWRDNAAQICLHFDAALRIGSDPAATFEEAATLLPEKSAIGLRSFLLRSTEDQSLEAMGYVVSADRDGPRYRRTW